MGPPVDIKLMVSEGPGLWHFLDVFSKPRKSEVAPVRGLVVDVVETEYGGGAKKLPPEILDAFFSMLSNHESQAMELVHLTVKNIFCRKSMTSLGAAVEMMPNLNSVELFSNGLQDGDVEVSRRFHECKQVYHIYLSYIVCKGVHVGLCKKSKP